MADTGGCRGCAATVEQVDLLVREVRGGVVATVPLSTIPQIQGALVETASQEGPVRKDTTALPEREASTAK